MCLAHFRELAHFRGHYLQFNIDVTSGSEGNTIRGAMMKELMEFERTNGRDEINICQMSDYLILYITQ